MKFHSLVAFLLTNALFLIGCSGGDRGSRQPSSQTQMTEDHSSHQKMTMDATKPTDESIYNVTSTWKNRDGKTLNLAELRGKIQVVAMVYTHCEHACPRILADMKRIRDGLSRKALGETNFVLVSIDPQRDTPKRLSRFADDNNLSETQWTLLNGARGDILELAALLGVRYKRISDTDFTHSNMISVLNKEGEIIHQRKKLEDQQSAVIAAIEQHTSN
ncbi:SCO family protein [Fodinibius sediminis]|uniref:Protein SCO1/2 n=1 Tax=Fodinibius sediminis TaxID=1214077 RepID=A0A521BLM1_9BACT|nr:SCO family protein [Fodinibius sediminis]SMO47540.1 protein SCO1/2 [Fodinibius sediminis]